MTATRHWINDFLVGILVLAVIFAVGYWCGETRVVADLRTTSEKVCMTAQQSTDNQQHCWTEVHDHRITK